MSQILKVLQYHRSKVNNVDICFFCCIGFRNGSDDHLQHIGFAGLRRANNHRIFAGNVNVSCFLRLGVWIVKNTNGHPFGHFLATLRCKGYPFRQRWQTNTGKPFNASITTICGNIFHHCIQLRNRLFIRGFILLNINRHSLAIEEQRENRKFAGCVYRLVFGSAAIGRLEQFENFIIANLQVSATRLLDLRRQGGLENLITILLRLDL